MSSQNATSPLDTNAQRLYTVFIVGVVAVCAILAKSIWLAGNFGHDGVKVDSTASTIYVPGLRGGIFTKDGKPLAWSERRIALCWQIPDCMEEAQGQLLQLQQYRDCFSQPSPLPEDSSVLKGLLGSSVEIALDAVEPLPLQKLQTLPFCMVKGVIVRCHSHPFPDELAETIGGIRQNESGLEIGISGLERDYDAQLRASLIPVTLSKNGHVVHLPNQLGNGQDIFLQ